jgi:alkylhydroperoxidase/carboxymuconolactone decarboxylase family protein YurZ
MTMGQDPGRLDSVAEIEAAYEDMIGFVPPKVLKRIETSAAIDIETLRIVERWRLNALTPAALDPRTVQLISFGILLAQSSDAARNHAAAAIKAGATKEELHAVAGIANLFRGIAAFNQAGSIIAELHDAGGSD